MTNITQEVVGFDGLGIEPKMLEMLDAMKFTIPTPIQVKSIPLTTEGKDIVGIAQTGTGKTLAFGIPLIQRLAKTTGQALILLPTRELAIQVQADLKELARGYGLHTALLIGGEPMGKQIFALRNNAKIIIATPGRLINHQERRTANLNTVKILVLDEADMMFDMGFEPQLRKILKTLPEQKQTMLFSATMPPEVVTVITKYMTMPVRIEVAPAGTPAENVSQEIIVLKAEDKRTQLEKILKDYTGSILIFARTKHGVRDLCKYLKALGHNSAEIHSNRSLGQRRESLDGFKAGKFRILVATDIAARGLDVKGIEVVLNYDLPENIEDYIHRIGRTGRAGLTGKAISFITASQTKSIGKIEKLTNKSIPLTKLVDFEISSSRSGASRFGGGRSGRSGGSRPSRFGSSARPASRDQSRTPFNNSRPSGGVNFRRDVAFGEGSQSSYAPSNPRRAGNSYEGNSRREGAFSNGGGQFSYAGSKTVGSKSDDKRFSKDRGASDKRFGNDRPNGDKRFGGSRQGDRNSRPSYAGSKPSGSKYEGSKPSGRSGQSSYAGSKPSGNRFGGSRPSGNRFGGTKPSGGSRPNRSR
jgi:ATP-dependent RNA helicase RhlE